jgi:hypothetical protein
LSRWTLLLCAAVVVTGGIAATAASARSSSGETIVFELDPISRAGDAVSLDIESPGAPFKNLALYPNGNFTISLVLFPDACHPIVAPQGQGVGCGFGSADHATVSFKTSPPMPAGTTAKLVLDNAGGSGARVFTVTLKSCLPQYDAVENAAANGANAYHAIEQALKRYSDAQLSSEKTLLADFKAAVAQLAKPRNVTPLDALAAVIKAEARLDNRLANLEKAMKDAARRYEDAANAYTGTQQALADCRKPTTSAVVLRTPASRVECSVPTLVQQLAGLRTVKVAPAFRRAIAEVTKLGKARALRDLRRLRGQVALSVRRTAAAVTALNACRPQPANP